MRLFTKYYAMFSIYTAMSFGTFNMLMDYAVLENTGNGHALVYLTGVPSILYFLFYHAIKAREMYKAKGTIWSKEESAYYTAKGKFDWRTLVLILIRQFNGAAQIFLSFLMTYTSQ